MKKILMFISTLGVFFLPHTYAAAQGIDLDLDEYEHEVTYQDDEITVGRFKDGEKVANIINNNSSTAVFPSEDLLHYQNPEIMPFKTIKGPGGVVTMNTSNDNRRIYWTAKPINSWPYLFKGNMRLNYFSGYTRNAPLTDYGSASKSASGYVQMNAHGGGTATMTGTAYATNLQVHNVMPHATLPYAPSR